MGGLPLDVVVTLLRVRMLLKDWEELSLCSGSLCDSDGPLIRLERPPCTSCTSFEGSRIDRGRTLILLFDFNSSSLFLQLLEMSGVHLTRVEEEAKGFLSDSESLELLGRRRQEERSCSCLSPLGTSVLLTVLLGLTLLGFPFYNKHVFGLIYSEAPPKVGALVALVPTIVMLLGATVLMALAEAIRVFVFRGDKTWLLQHEGLWFKAKHLLLPAVLFAAVLGLTNTSLSLTSVNLHVLIRTSMLIWLVLFAWLFQGERPSLIALLLCVVLAAGVVMVSIHPDVSWSLKEDWVALVLTLLSAVAQAALLVATRWTAKVLGLRASLQLSAVKAFVAAVILLPLAGGLDPHGWNRLSLLSNSTLGWLVGGAAVTALFQTMLVMAESVTLALSVGVLSVAVVIPQITIGLIIHPQVLGVLAIVGYVLAPLGAVGFAIERFVSALRARKDPLLNPDDSLVN